MRILVSGATGLIGRALEPSLIAAGHTVCRLTRHPVLTTDVVWDPSAGTIQTDKLGGFDAVIHLAGESIASGRWTRSKKARLHASRVEGTNLLVEALQRSGAPPKVFISASAIGFYGDRGDEIVDEESCQGTGFLADLCADWERASQRLTTARVVIPRFGIVLSPDGGALKQMLTPFKLCLGGRLGSGRQYYSWIGIDDVVNHLCHALTDDRLQGPVNFVSPNPVDNATFTKVLGRVLRRPTPFPMPAMAVGLIFGEMGDALLLASCRAVPKRLTSLGMSFAFPDLELCLRHILSIG